MHTTIAGVNKDKAPGELKDIENFKPGFTFYEAGGKTLFYNLCEPKVKIVEGEEITITNNIFSFHMKSYFKHITYYI